MRIHYLQHVPFEDLANIKPWAEENGYLVSETNLYRNPLLPNTKDFDWLIIMGGPMSIYEEDKYPWLAQEKKFIEKAIQRGKTVLGICLGGQLIADVLGAKVSKGEHKEIGWFPVQLTPEAEKSSVFSALPKEFLAFHWHGDTFDIPEGAFRTAKSEAYANQAFEYQEKVFALQFHLEFSQGNVQRLMEHCSDELVKDKYIQTEPQLFGNEESYQKIQSEMTNLLDTIKKRCF